MTLSLSPSEGVKKWVPSWVLKKRWTPAVSELAAPADLNEPPSMVSSPFPEFKTSLPSLPVIRAESLWAIYDEIPLLLS